MPVRLVSSVACYCADHLISVFYAVQFIAFFYGMKLCLELFNGIFFPKNCVCIKISCHTLCTLEAVLYFINGIS